jgi:hypothetical protein
MDSDMHRGQSHSRLYCSRIRTHSLRLTRLGRSSISDISMKPSCLRNVYAFSTSLPISNLISLLSAFAALWVLYHFHFCSSLSFSPLARRLITPSVSATVSRHPGLSCQACQISLALPAVTASSPISSAPSWTRGSSIP